MGPPPGVGAPPAIHHMGSAIGAVQPVQPLQPMQQPPPPAIGVSSQAGVAAPPPAVTAPPVVSDTETPIPAGATPKAGKAPAQAPVAPVAPVESDQQSFPWRAPGSLPGADGVVACDAVERPTGGDANTSNLDMDQ